MSPRRIWLKLDPEHKKKGWMLLVLVGNRLGSPLTSPPSLPVPLVSLPPRDLGSLPSPQPILGLSDLGLDSSLVLRVWVRWVFVQFK
jgi:hypothetical protein